MTAAVVSPALFGELILPYETIARSKVSKDSSGCIRIAVDEMQVILEIGAMSDRLAFFARLEEWSDGSGTVAEGGGRRAGR